MSDKIEVCGKLAIQSHVYFFNDGANLLQLGILGSDGFYNTKTHLMCIKENVKNIEGVNGEALEDAPFKPEKGDWCLFGDRTVRRFVHMGRDLYCDEYGFKWNICKPVSPELAALLDKELD